MKIATINVNFPPLTPRQFFHFCRAKLGKTYLGKKFRVDERTVERWTADERFVGEESVRKNPLEKICECMEDLIAYGHLYEVRGILCAMAEMSGCRIAPIEELEIEDEADIRDLMLNNDQGMQLLHMAMRQWMHPRKIRMLASAVITEIEESVRKYPEMYEVERKEQTKTGSGGSAFGDF